MRKPNSTLRSFPIVQQCSTLTPWGLVALPRILNVLAFFYNRFTQLKVCFITNTIKMVQMNIKHVNNAFKINSSKWKFELKCFFIQLFIDWRFNEFLSFIVCYFFSRDMKKVTFLRIISVLCKNYIFNNIFHSNLIDFLNFRSISFLQAWYNFHI